MAEVKFSVHAYCKMILHAAKYPHCAVNGVLLAECPKNKDNKKTKSLVLVDAIPLFHLCLHVSPMAEVALTQIDSMTSSSGLIIAGYYVANENIRDLSTDKPANRIADKIAENFSSACLVIIDNRRLSFTVDEPAIILEQYMDSKWKTVDKSSWSLHPLCLEVTASLLQQQEYEKLVDFDNHLDNIALDWRNKDINTTVDELIQEEETH